MGAERPPLPYRRQWRDYTTAAGRRPVKEYLNQLDDEDYARVQADLREVSRYGLQVARHLRGDIYEVRTDGEDSSYRVLFAAEGRYSQVLLSLEAFPKKTQQTPPAKIQLAERRLADWRNRATS